MHGSFLLHFISIVFNNDRAFSFDLVQIRKTQPNQGYALRRTEGKYEQQTQNTISNVIRIL